MGIEQSMKIKKIHEIVQSYRPGSTVETPGPVKFDDTLLIGLFGHTGCGKTSLINSIKCAANGEPLRKAQWVQSAGQEMGGGHTMYRKRVEITKKIAVVDNRGMDKINTAEAMEELCAQLVGTRGYSEIVRWDGSKKDIGKHVYDKIATAVFVFSALHDIEGDIEGLPYLISTMHTTQGHYPLAVITHVDQVKQKIVEEVKAVLRANGVSDSCIFTVANVTDHTSKLKKEYELTLLELLDRCMNDGDQAMIFHHHKVTEKKRIEVEAKLRAELRAIKAQQHLSGDQTDRLTAFQKQLLEEAIEENRKEYEKAKADAGWCTIL